MGGDKGKGKGSTSGSSSKTKHKKQKGADQPNPPSQDPGGDPWPEDVGDPFYPDQPRSVPDFNEQDVAGGSSTGNYTHQPSPPVRIPAWSETPPCRTRLTLPSRT